MQEINIKKYIESFKGKYIEVLEYKIPLKGNHKYINKPNLISSMKLNNYELIQTQRFEILNINLKQIFEFETFIFKLNIEIFEKSFDINIESQIFIFDDK